MGHDHKGVLPNTMLTFNNLPPGEKLFVAVIAVGKNGMNSKPNNVPIYTSKCLKSNPKERVCIFKITYMYFQYLDLKWIKHWTRLMIVNISNNSFDIIFYSNHVCSNHGYRIQCSTIVWTRKLMRIYFSYHMCKSVKIYLLPKLVYTIKLQIIHEMIELGWNGYTV